MTTAIISPNGLSGLSYINVGPLEKGHATCCSEELRERRILKREKEFLAGLEVRTFVNYCCDITWHIFGDGSFLLLMIPVFFTTCRECRGVSKTINDFIISTFFLSKGPFTHSNENAIIEASSTFHRIFRGHARIFR